MLVRLSARVHESDSNSSKDDSCLVQITNSWTPAEVSPPDLVRHQIQLCFQARVSDESHVHLVARLRLYRTGVSVTVCLTCKA